MLPPNCQLIVRCTRDAMRCTGPYHLKSVCMYVCVCVCVCVCTALSFQPATQMDVDGWLSCPEHEDAWMWMGVPPARAPPPTADCRLQTALQQTKPVCKPLGAGALPHTQAAAALVCVSIAFMFHVPKLCCSLDMYGVSGTHTRTCFQWPTPPPRSGRAGVNVAGVAGVVCCSICRYSCQCSGFQPLASLCIVLLGPIRVGYVTMHFNVQECGGSGGGWTGEGWSLHS
jgi:hypothetical protein